MKLAQLQQLAQHQTARSGCASSVFVYISTTI